MSLGCPSQHQSDHCFAARVRVANSSISVAANHFLCESVALFTPKSTKDRFVMGKIRGKNGSDVIGRQYDKTNLEIIADNLDGKVVGWAYCRNAVVVYHRHIVHKLVI